MFFCRRCLTLVVFWDDIGGFPISLGPFGADRLFQYLIICFYLNIDYGIHRHPQINGNCMMYVPLELENFICLYQSEAST